MILVVPTGAASSDSNRLSYLKHLRQSSSNDIIDLTSQNLDQLIETAPRSYSLFVFFSADEQICPPCKVVKDQLRLLAKQFYSLSTSKRARKPTFFAIVQLSQADQVFVGKYSIQRVPIFYHFRAGKSNMFPISLENDSPDNYPFQQLGLASNALKEFINARSGSQMRIVATNYQIPFVQTVRTFMPWILAFVAFIGAVIVITGAYKNPMVWFAIIMIIYIFSVGGGHYSWIHNTPLAVVNSEGAMEYVAGGSRSQYVAEGFFVSATCVSISILVILVQELPSVMPNKHGQTVIGMGLVFMTCLAIMSLLTLYHAVSSHFTPPLSQRLAAIRKGLI